MYLTPPRIIPPRAATRRRLDFGHVDSHFALLTGFLQCGLLAVTHYTDTVQVRLLKTHSATGKPAGPLCSGRGAPARGMGGGGACRRAVGLVHGTPVTVPDAAKSTQQFLWGLRWAQPAGAAGPPIMIQLYRAQAGTLLQLGP